jgi:hypothetical protein
MKVGKDNRIIQTKVDLLDYHIYSESYVPIALGVKPDDKIVSTGSGFLSDGDLVKVAPGGKQ